MSTAEVLAFERPLPHSPDAERSVLASLCLSAFLGVNVLARVSAIITPEDFFNDAHKTIYTAILTLDNDGVAIESRVVAEYLRDRGELERCGGYSYLSALTEFVPDTANVEHFARSLRSKGDARRQLTAFNSAMRDLANGADPALISMRVSGILDTVSNSRAVTAPLLDAALMAQRLTELYDKGGVERGVSTGWPSLDAFYTIPSGAWTLVTGVPGHGKSGVLDHMAVNLANNLQWRIAMFSAENSPAESHLASLIEKYVGAPFNEGPTSRMTPQEMRAGLGFLFRHFRFMDPAADHMTVDRILATASGMMNDDAPINMLVIDPWNELHHERPSNQREDEYISASLTKVRRWARRHRAHVFIVVHPTKLMKGADGRYPVPTPYDCSGGAQWRNKADYCLTVYRELGEIESPEVNIHVQKVRRREIGKLGVATLRYNKITGQYEDPSARRLSWEERQERLS